MASLIHDPGGRKRIVFTDPDGRRRAVRLGETTTKLAGTVRDKITAIVAAKVAHSTVDPEVSAWLAKIGVGLHAKLAAVGLVEPREAVKSVSLGGLLDRYFSARADIKPSTVLVWDQARKSLLDYFGAGKPAKDIHEGDAELWGAWMAKEGFAEATRRKRAQNAKQFFAFGIRQRIVTSNPFSGLKSSAKGNDKRLYFLSVQDAEKILEACPDAQWRLIFALARFGGLRTPSEMLLLRWTDVDWDRGRFTVHSPKTEHQSGGDSRVVPIFPELRPLLMQAFEEAEPGTEYVITRYRTTGVNLRTQLMRILARAGLKPWPRLFQNLRSSRETELTQSFPLHVVTAWIGNSQPIAMRHYLQVRDSDFEQAAQPPLEAARQAARQTARTGSEQSAQSRKEFPVTPAECPENADLLITAGTCDTLPQFPVAPRGFEPLSPG